MITHDRPQYLRITLPALLASLPEYSSLVVWDNASGEETKALLEQHAEHPRVERIVHSRTNCMLREPTNWFWDYAGASDFLSKVDDDCLQTSGWCDRLLEAHSTFQRTGILACWRFYPEDEDARLINRKLLVKGNQRLMLNCWVQGSGYLMKREVIARLGPLSAWESFPAYCIRAAAAGYINGFPYPFIFEDHFDDPRSHYSVLKTDEDLRSASPLSAAQFQIHSIEDWIRHQREQARILQIASVEPRDYTSLRARVVRRIYRMTGRRYLPVVRTSGAHHPPVPAVPH